MTQEAAPLRVQDLPRKFDELLVACGGSTAQPDSAIAWRAFLELAAFRLVSEPSEPQIFEDMIMFEAVSESHNFPPVLRLVRRIGFEDEQGDYVYARTFACELAYDRHSAEIANMRSDEIAADLLPTDKRHGALATFVADVESSHQFRVLVLDERPQSILTTL